MVSDPPEAAAASRDMYQHLIRREFPPDFGPALLSSISDAYRAAVEFCFSAYAEPEAFTHLGQQRRVEVETAFQRVAERFDLPCVPVPNPANNHFHRELRTRCMVLSVCHAPSPASVRSAVHRSELAAASQGDLWSLFREHDETHGKAFGILVHHEHPLDYRQLGSAVVAFPDADCDRYRTEVDLLRMFPDVLPRPEVAKRPVKPRLVTRRSMPVDEERVPQPTPMKLRRQTEENQTE